jgi:hypothetical protein
VSALGIALLAVAFGSVLVFIVTTILDMRLRRRRAVLFDALVEELDRSRAERDALRHDRDHPYGGVPGCRACHREHVS